MGQISHRRLTSRSSDDDGCRWSADGQAKLTEVGSFSFHPSVKALTESDQKTLDNELIQHVITHRSKNDKALELAGHRKGL
jgi:hypothetical protein